MRKVLVDRELLERIARDDEGAASFADFEELKRVLAQPAEAEGVDFGFDDRSVKVNQEAYSIFLARERHHLAALSAVTAERNALAARLGEWERSTLARIMRENVELTAEVGRLRDAAGKAIAWLDAEQNGSGVGINRRIKLCRDAENSLRAAIAAKEG